MKGSQRLQLHSRAQSQGNIRQNYNQIAQERELDSRKRLLRNKIKEDFHQHIESTHSITPQQSFSSGFYNHSQSYFSNNSSPHLKKIGLNFKINRSNEIEQVIQQKLTMLRSTNANSFYESNKNKDIYGGLNLNNTQVFTPQNNQLRSTDYFSKNIASNQIIFKQLSSTQNKTHQRQQSEKSLLHQKLLNDSQELIDKQQQAQDIQKFVKDLYKPNQHKIQQGQNLINQINLETRDDKQSMFNFYNNEQSYKINTPKLKDIFVTKVSNSQFTSNSYSKVVLKDKYQQFSQQNRQLRNKFSQIQVSPDSTRIQKSTQLNASRTNDSVDYNQAKQNVINHNYSDAEVPDLVIPQIDTVNPIARAKIQSAFKKTGEAERNNYLNSRTSSPKNKKESEQLNQIENTQQSQNGFQGIKLKKIERQNSQLEKEKIKIFNKEKFSFFVLLVFIDNLSNVKRKNNLKYKIYQIPYIAQKQIEDDFEEMKQNLKKLLGLNMKYLYFFKQNGTPLATHLNFQQVDYNNEAIFFGSQGVFQGVQNIFCTQENQKSLKNSIQSLLDKVKLLNKNYVFQNEANNLLPNQIDENNSSSNQNDLNQYKILTREQISQIRNRSHVNKIAQALMHNPNAIIKEYHPHKKQELKLLNIETEYQNQINQIKKSVTELPNEYERSADKSEIKNLREIAKYIDIFLDDIDTKRVSKEKKKEKSDVKNHYHGLDDLWSIQKEQKKTNYIQQNIEKFHNKSSLMKELQNQNRELFIQNIPKLLNKYELSRHDLHSIYILYKALLTVSIQKIDYKDVFEKGMDFKTFELGVDRLSSQAEEIIRRMCNYKSFIDWKSFLQILSSIQGKDLESKVNIFIQVCDVDKSGNLSRIEIEELCRICLQKFVLTGKDDILDQLVEYFTRLLFSSLNVELDQEIPLTKIKSAIIDGHPESDLLCFFCGIS